MHKFGADLLGGYYRDGYILFDGLFLPAEVAKLLAIQKTRPNEPLARLVAARDTFTQNSDTSKLLFPRKLSTLVYQITRELTLRAAASQFFDFPEGCLLLSNKPLPFRQLFCVQKIIMGVIICLEDSPDQTLPFIPKKAGSATFINPNQPHNWSELKGHLLLLAYGPVEVNYTECENDPCTNEYKRKGYTYGDPHTLTTHPLLLQN